MKKPDLPSYEEKELVDFVSQATSMQIESTIAKMSHEQIMISVKTVNLDSDKDWKDKIKAIVLGLNERSDLEAVGSTISIKQFIELINSCLHIEDKHHWKVSPILVGMNHEIFSSLLAQLSDTQLQTFKDESVTEPVQHHLTTLTHKMEREIEKGENAIDLLYERVDHFKLEEIGLHDIREVIKEIKLFQEFFDQLYRKSNKALAIAWNTKRLDLIESLNRVKDACHKFVMYGLGAQANDQRVSSGLYHLLEEKLFEVYGNNLDPNDSEAVRDTEPAVEGLAKLSVWYLRDYWDIGLLPEIADKESLDLDLDKHSETERVQYREELFTKAQENLAALGLISVKDLKTQYIFSKKSLQEYIQEKMPSIVQP